MVGTHARRLNQRFPRMGRELQRHCSTYEYESPPAPSIFLYDYQLTPSQPELSSGLGGKLQQHQKGLTERNNSNWNLPSH